MLNKKKYNRQMGEKVKLNKYNFYEVEQHPTTAELEEYYSEKYYQTNRGSFENEYSESELTYFQNKIEQKYWVINNLIDPVDSRKTFLDVGCGEGFTLNFFKKKGWKVTGIDYSDHGCKKFNAGCLPDLLVGDIFHNISYFVELNKKFDVIWIDNVLEHVLEPLNLLKECNSLLDEDGLLIVEVPNDFSILQKYLLSNKYIDSEFWIVVPDHISYFNLEGLSSLALEAGLKNVFTMSDYPVDFNLINPDTSKGKNVHKSRIEIDNLMHSISVEKSVNYYKALADLGFGRQIISFFKHV
jgi:2-polyprenyl-3-methyl-5-hydroxy-6-metoxy-1,4-benzoquinol methylase